MTTHVLWVLIHCLAVLVFVNRYIAGVVLRRVRGTNWDEFRTDGWEPTVTAIIPMYNEGAAIKETLQSLLDSDYPASKLRVICVDDCSTDDSYEQARTVARTSGGRLRILRNPVNLGKRGGIIRAVREADCEIVVSVDSDVVVDRDAVRQLVKRFTSEKIAAVGGWVDVRNKHENWLTRMQVVKYWYSYFFLKNLEWGFRRVMCLSGCLTAYRRSVLMELEPLLLERSILGCPIKYGEDRFLTRQIVKAGWLTTMTLDARCCTFVPNTVMSYLSQQLRWRRSNIVDYAGGFSHVWRLNPVLAIHFFSLFALIIVYPIAIVRALEAHRFWPAMQYHLEMMVAFGLYYRWRVRKLPKHERVSALSFASLTLLMPITYALLTPLALFTLDTGSWETRGHAAEQLAELEALGEPTAATITGQHVLVPAATAAATATADPARTRARSQAQLPAA